ncbi:MAG: hypothetical protein KatS3mg115_1277 [Candidatus Poribacteria bacterium]|nr:MAG: hypothetical protein KatS3mg115_1277 [Candidatus Poribacteria bacterium]
MREATDEAQLREALRELEALSQEAVQEALPSAAYAVGIAFEEANQTARRLDRQVYALSLGLMLATLLIVGSVWFFISRRITQALSRLHEDAGRVKKGDLTHPVRVAGDDEIGQIAQGFQEITQQLLQALEQLRLAKEAAEAANRMKSQFLASISHDIRTPMNAILGFSDLLAEEIENPRQRESLELIRSAGRQLLALLNDLLDLSKIEAGRLELRPVDVDLRQMIAEIRAVYLPKCQQKGIAFHVDVGESVPELLSLDEVRLRQVLINLVDNAVKFTEQGRVAVRVRAIHAGAEPDRCDLCLEVEDTGPGIPPEEQERIFEPFQQKQGQDHKRFGGTGLGLAITKRLVELMNGTIALDSVPGKGTIFHLLLHRVKILSELSASQDKAEGVASQPERIQLPEATVLIVDDDAATRRLIRAYLEDQPVQCREAKTGLEAWEMLQVQPVDLVLLDLHMPQMDGSALIRKMRAEPKTRELPVIIMTAAVFAESLPTEALRVGYLRKPFRGEELLDALANALSTFGASPSEPETDPASALSPRAFWKEGTPLPSELLEKLRDWLPTYDSLQETVTIGELEQFARAVVALGEEYGLPELARWGKELQSAAERFDIEAIERALREFQPAAERLRSSSSQE